MSLRAPAGVSAARGSRVAEVGARKTCSLRFCSDSLMCSARADSAKRMCRLSALLNRAAACCFSSSASAFVRNPGRLRSSENKHTCSHVTRVSSHGVGRQECVGLRYADGTKTRQVEQLGVKRHGGRGHEDACHSWMIRLRDTFNVTAVEAAGASSGALTVTRIELALHKANVSCTYR
jgi:hypothetical protein